MSAIDRLFDNIAKIGNDQCDLTNKNKQNIEFGNYMLKNFTVYNPISNALNLATNQPNVFFSGGVGGGINSNNIDENSSLRFSQTTNQPERSVYQERIFSTVPYLGRGPTNAPVESELIMGDIAMNRKSLDPNSEVSHINYNLTPLIPSVEATINNPANLVEGVAAEGWIRGGIPSRILNRAEDAN
jgi:hypothetical protein